ncbi:MAG: hypothetical protein WBN70_01535 [Polyangiales bacterium]
MSTRFHLISWLALSLLAFAGCSRDGTADEDGRSGQAARGNDAAMSAVQAAARAIAEPAPSVDYVAAQMAGTIKARTNSQALMYYDGYRVTLTTPGNRVTRIVFELTDARPSMEQLTKVFGKPEEVGRGMLYSYYAAATGATINILAEPVSKPATDTSLVRRILIEGARIR